MSESRSNRRYKRKALSKKRRDSLCGIKPEISLIPPFNKKERINCKSINEPEIDWSFIVRSLETGLIGQSEEYLN